MIRATIIDATRGTLRTAGPELIDEWEQTEDALIWVVLENETRETEEDLLAGRFGIHPLAMADAFRERHPPKIEQFENNTFILLKGLDAISTSIDLNTIQLSMFVGDRFLVTRSNGHSVSTARLLTELTSDTLPKELSSAAIALRLCRTVADRFLPILLSVERRLEEMETEMLEHPSDKLLGELVHQKGRLKRVLRVLQYHAQIFTSATAKAPRHLDGYHHELVDVQEQLDRQLSLARLHYELADDLMTGYLSLSAHRLNQIMQTLTIVTVIFVPITFMAGVYGMNFEYMPELGFRGSYFILLGAMLAVVATILVFFRRRGWVGRKQQD